MLPASALAHSTHAGTEAVSRLQSAAERPTHVPSEHLLVFRGSPWARRTAGQAGTVAVIAARSAISSQHSSFAAKRAATWATSIIPPCSPPNTVEHVLGNPGPYKRARVLDSPLIPLLKVEVELTVPQELGDELEDGSRPSSGPSAWPLFLGMQGASAPYRA